MRIRKMGGALAVVVVMASGAVWAQEGPPGMTPEQQQMMQQMQELQQKIRENMQKQGIDPREFAQEMMQKMQDGSFDMNEFNQELVDKGLIDQETLTKAQQSMQKLTMDGIKRQLEVTDAEWGVIEPKLAQVIAARNKLRAGNPFGGGVGGLAGMGAFMAGQSGPNELAVAMRELRVVLRDKGASQEVISAKLQAVRDAREKVNAELTAAQKDLEDLLTIKQEATLFRLGLIS